MRSAALLALLAAVACGSEGPPWADGMRRGGALSAVEKARYHYDTPLRPTSSRPFASLTGEVVETDEGRLYQYVVYSRTYEIDGYYKAMVGPHGAWRVPMPRERLETEPELLWIKGIHAEVVDEDGDPLSQEYTCHLVASLATLDAHNAALGLEKDEARFTALAQGFYHKEYPRGFGLPVLSTDELGLLSQVLNYNTPIGDEPLRARHKIVILYMRDRDRKIPMKAITNAVALATVRPSGTEEEGYYGIRAPDREVHGEACATGYRVESRAPTLIDEFGRRFSSHWVIEPGRSTNQTLVTEMLGLEADTTIHTVDVHLHPFGEWVELRDLTTGETVFRSEAEQLGRGVGLTSVQHYQSEKGLPIYADHQYAIVTEYHNTSGEPQDAMAMLYLGLHDVQFDRALRVSSP